MAKRKQQAKKAEWQGGWEGHGEEGRLSGGKWVEADAEAIIRQCYDIVQF